MSEIKSFLTSFGRGILGLLGELLKKLLKLGNSLGGAISDLLDGGKSIDIERLTLENERSKQRIQEMEEQIKKMSNLAQRRRDESRDQEDEIEELEEEVSILRKKLKDRDAEVSQLQDEINNLKMENTQLQVELETQK